MLAQLCGLLMSPISRTAVVLGALAAKKGGGAKLQPKPPPLERAAYVPNLFRKFKMAFDKDAFLTALDSMTVMELNDLVKAIEEKFGVSAAAMAAPAAGGGGAAAAGRRREDRVHRAAAGSRRQQGVRSSRPCAKSPAWA